MIATFTWVLGGALILVLLAVFLWSAHNKQKNLYLGKSRW